MEKNIKAKEPWMGVLLNQIFPGLGELYAGKKARAFVIIGIAILFLLIGLSAIHIATDPNIKFTATLVAGGMLFGALGFIFGIFVLFDGYLCVRRYNISNGVKASNFTFRVLVIVGIIALHFVNPAVAIRNSFKAFKISSDSMKPTLQKGDLIIVDRKTYVKNMPQRQDAVIFIFPKDRSKSFIQRIVGLPGETLEIKNGKIFINKMELEGKFYYYNRGNFGAEGQTIKIPQDSYYVLGDNSATSNDSRYWGFVPLKNIQGRAIKIYWPLTRANKIE